MSFTKTCYDTSIDFNKSMPENNNSNSNITNGATTRLNILSLAQAIENNRVTVERLRLENNWKVECEISSQKIQKPPPFPEIESVDAGKILRVAQRLMEFVNQRD